MRILQPTIEEVNNPVATRRIGFGVGHLHNRCSLLVQTLEQFHDLLTLCGMEIPRGLVGKKEPGFGDHSPRNGDQLLSDAEGLFIAPRGDGDYLARLGMTDLG